jgi:glucose dehydrogenase
MMRPCLLLSLLGLVACGRPPAVASAPGPSAAQVDAARLVSAGDDPANWLTHGRTYSEQRFSPLDQINTTTVSTLGLAWSLDLDTDRGQEATPIVVDGLMYSTSAWSKVQAIDAATGRLLWQYDPKVPGETGAKACCDVVNRGSTGGWSRSTPRAASRFGRSPRPTHRRSTRSPARRASSKAR